MSTYSYFASYAHSAGFGHINITTSDPIDRYERIELVHREISRCSGIPADQIAILNFHLLDGPTAVAR